MKRGKDSRAVIRIRRIFFSQNGAEKQRYTHSVVKAWKWGAHCGYLESSRGSLQELWVSQLRAVAMLLTARDGRGGSTTCESLTYPPWFMGKKMGAIIEFPESGNVKRQYLKEPFTPGDHWPMGLKIHWTISVKAHTFCGDWRSAWWWLRRLNRRCREESAMSKIGLFETIRYAELHCPQDYQGS